jgi:hypothetical protein
MSGKPSSDGVERFLAAIERVARAQDRIYFLQGELQRRKTELEYENGEYASAATLMRKLMEEMDVAATGNAGYESRAAWFFAEVYKQTHKPIPVATES